MVKKWMLLISALSLLAMLVVLSVPACSSSQKSCTTDVDCQPDEFCAIDGKCHKKGLPDGQDGDGNGGPDGDQPTDSDHGPPPCQHDRECPPDQACEDGECVAGIPCNEAYNCPGGLSEHYCHPQGKVCKDRSALCEPCTEDYECPDPNMGDMCIDYPDGGYCGMRCGTQACPAGYECDLTSGSGTGTNPGQCRCIGNVCGNCFVCREDSDCAANKVCDRSTGKCVPKCTDGTCAAGKKCHYTGHCGTPCVSDADCNLYGDDLICCIAPGVPSQYCDQNSTGKCRPSGCVLHSECEVTGGNSLGYCDKRTNTCMPGCREANTSTINDCTSGMMCVCNNGEVSCDGFDCCPDPGESGVCLCDPEDEDCSQVTVCDNGTCEKIPCDQRGVHIACARNLVCCGYPTADGYPCPAGVPEGDCYVAPKEIWCSTCGNSGDPCQVTGYGYGEPGICLQDSDSNTYCHLACRDSEDCPATWQCDYSFGQGCQQASDCESTATCESFTTSEGDQVSVCVCQADADCPSDFNGFEGHCTDEIICDHTADPNNPDCTTWKICQFAKACQCSNCCEALHSGG